MCTHCFIAIQTVREAPHISTASFMWSVKSRAKVHANHLQRMPLHLSYVPLLPISRRFTAVLRIILLTLVSLIAFSTLVLGHM